MASRAVMMSHYLVERKEKSLENRQVPPNVTKAFEPFVLMEKFVQKFLLFVVE